MASNPANLWVLLGLGLAGILIVTRKLKKAVKPDFGAFVERFRLLPPPQPAPPKAPHPLTGLSFAVSDVFDIDGFVTGFGHPEWSKSHEIASQTAPVVSSLVEGGATCVGKTVVDELAFSISGENKHFGMPTNPMAHSRIPGGSSSGAAVAVAANLVDFSLGTDTVGDVRVPAGYCGILGFRSSHGAVSPAGSLPVSPSLGAVGWFAKDPSILRRVGHLLLQVSFTAHRNPRTVIIADDCFQPLKAPYDRVSEVVVNSTMKLFGRQVLKHENLGDYFGSKVPSLKMVHSNKLNGEAKSSYLALLGNVMQLLKRHEFRQGYKGWIDSVKPVVDPLILAQIHEKMDIDDVDIDDCHNVRTQIRSALDALLKDDGILVIPTVSDPPPKLGSKDISSEDHLNCAFSVLGIASLSGCCQVTVPLGLRDKCPVSVSFIARYGADRFLLDTVQTMYKSLQEEVDLVTKSKPSTSVIGLEESAEIAKEKGNQAYKGKQWQRAVGFYTEAIKLNGNSSTYYSNRAAAYLEMGSYLQAEADCTSAIELDKKNVKAYFRRGTAREMLGYYKEAIEDFNHALVLEPTNKRAAVAADKLKKLFQ